MNELFKDLKKFILKISDVRLFTDMSEFKKYTNYGHDGLCGMTFDGELYDAINYHNNPDLIIELDMICETHDVFYELGDAFNCAFYKK